MGEEQECMVFLTRSLTTNSFIPASLIKVFSNPSPCLFKHFLSLALVLLKCPALLRCYHF